MSHRFHCTACGKCCYGQLPLTVKDAFSHAHRFPLALIWTPLRQGSKDYARVAELGTAITLPNRKQLAALIVPTAFLPPTFPCPELGEDRLCRIHHEKPSRCRTMPFYPYREEQYQAELLKPRPGWECDTSEAAPLVFANKKILAREDFDHELAELQEQHPLIQRYADYMLKYTPTLLSTLAGAAAKAVPRQVVTSLSSFLTATRHTDARGVAARQLPVLNHYAQQTAGQKTLAEFHDQYCKWAKEMAYLARPESSAT